MTDRRRLCTRCFTSMVKREQAVIEPLLRVIEPVRCSESRRRSAGAEYGGWGQGVGRGVGDGGDINEALWLVALEADQTVWFVLKSVSARSAKAFRGKAEEGTDFDRPFCTRGDNVPILIEGRHNSENVVSRYMSTIWLIFSLG